MRSISFIAGLLATICFAWCATAAAQTCELIYKWEQGETVATRLTIEQDRTIGPLPSPADESKKKTKDRKRKRRGGNDREEDDIGQPCVLPIDYGSKSQKLVCDFDVKTTEVDADGAALLEMTFRRVEAAADLAEGERFTFDSAKPEKDAKGWSKRSQTLADLIGKTMTMRIGRDGRMIEAKGVDQLVEALASLQEQNALGAALIEKMNGADSGGGGGIDEMFSMGPRFLPGKPVKRGEQWTTGVEHTLPIVGKVRTVWDSTLASLKRVRTGQIATIKSEASIRVNQPASGMPGMDGLPPGVDLQFMPGTGTAETVFDVDAGRAVSAEMSLDMSVAVRWTQPGVETVDGVMQTVTCRMKNEVMEGTRP